MEDGEHTHLLRALHTHDDRVEIIYIRKGSGIHTVGSKTYHTKQGDILLYNAGVLHDESAKTLDGMEILSCAIRDVKVVGLPEHCLTPIDWCPVIQDGVCSAEVEALLIMLYTSALDPAKINEVMQRDLLRVLLMLVHGAAKRCAALPISQGAEVGHRVQQYIDEHYKEDISLEEVAAHMRMSVYYIMRAFKDTVGLSPMQYIIRRRIGEAQSYLLMTDKSVTEIAYIVGYNAASNFNNAFRSLVGMTPKKYREHWKQTPGM